MRRLIVALAVALVAGSGSLGVALAPMPLGAPEAGALGAVERLLGADSWLERVQAVPASPLAGVVVPAFHEERSVPELVGAVYGHLGFVLSEEEGQVLADQVDGLDPRVVMALQQLLGAIEVGMGGWSAATAGLTPEDWEVLADWDGALNRPAEVEAAVAKMDAGLIQGSAVRLLAVIDEVSPWLAAAADAAPAGQASVLTTPNEGLLFHDPLNLVMVGDTGPSVYWRNTAPGSIAPGSHVLIIDLGGDDSYYLSTATAAPLPVAGICLNMCNGGVPVSLLVDVSGNDRYEPQLVPYCCSMAGGAGWAGGIGMLLDASGDDVHLRPTSGQGTGGARGIGMVLDSSGMDSYSAGSQSQGYGQATGGFGLLFDLVGNDRYATSSGNSQGFGTYNSVGALVDFGGSDVFQALALAQGHARHGGAGVFIGIGGNDAYSSGSESRGWSGTCFELSAMPLCSSTGLEDLPGLFLDWCGVDSYAGWLGQDDSMWQQNANGLGIDDNNPPGLDCGKFA